MAELAPRFMDSLSQIVLGASVAEVVVGRKVGNKAILWGAIAGTLPDLDVISNAWLSEFAAMSSHRGFTHSLLFCVLAAPVLGWIIHRIYALGQHKQEEWLHKRITDGGVSDMERPSVKLKGYASRYNWSMMAFWVFLTHIALDCCTTWGTMVFWPSDFRVTTNSMFVADPLYTVPFMVLLIAAMFYNRRRKTRRVLNYTGLVLSTFYLSLGLVNKARVNPVFERSFVAQDMQVIRYESRPAPLNILLWMCSAETEEGIYLGFYSVMDKDEEIAYRYFPKQHELLGEYASHPDVKKIIHMSDDYYVVRKGDDGLEIYDLRFGLMSGWDMQGDEDFVFRYNLIGSPTDLLVDVSDPPQPDGEEAAEFLSLFYRRIMGDKTASIDGSK